VACGADGPWHLYATLAGLPLAPQPAPVIGRKVIIPTLELHAAPAYVKAGDLSIPRLLGSYRGVRSVSGLSLIDPAPMVSFAGARLAHAVRRATSAGRRNATAS
jgi:D-aspartate ligase